MSTTPTNGPYPYWGYDVDPDGDYAEPTRPPSSIIRRSSVTTADGGAASRAPQRSRTGPPPPAVPGRACPPTGEPVVLRAHRIDPATGAMPAVASRSSASSRLPVVQPVAPTEQGRRPHWLLTGALGVAVSFCLFTGGQFASAWWHTSQDDAHYGRPRTMQVDAVVGHQDSRAHPSHFIALNLRRQVLIIELPGGDATHMRVFMGPVLMGEGSDLVPVTLEVRDVNGDHTPDLVVHIQQNTVVFVNDGGTFRLATERDHLPSQQAGGQP